MPTIALVGNKVLPSTLLATPIMALPRLSSPLSHRRMSSPERAVQPSRESCVTCSGADGGLGAAWAQCDMSHLRSVKAEKHASFVETNGMKSFFVPPRHP
jgi:hypothetical protein